MCPDTLGLHWEVGSKMCGVDRAPSSTRAVVLQGDVVWVLHAALSERIRSWNSLSEHIKLATNINEFKILIKQYLSKQGITILYYCSIVYVCLTVV